MAIQDEYTVRLSSFEGPLDLLLYLIRRAEVDIHDIPIVEITDQFLTAIATLGDDDRIDIDAAGEFLVIEGSDPFHHLSHVAAAFTDAKHAYSDRRRQTIAFQRIGQ